ncbi:GFA family protein [Altericroceibacterium spongiae]|uniref:GFA family protein n=1 Tax=Altericroceibacterium spongiae TaxID=2320269 RepID=A0A420EN06_9SPHN|nr:GFA family protein [Altericroceibacterium spongiae]RKF21984.1 GFA family protein [Altericroceibacterium spongiae]
MNGSDRLGGCHCGAIRFSVIFPKGLTGSRCNCSICSMKGYVALYTPVASLQIVQGEDDLAMYSFHSGVARHYFCQNCGIHCFHQARSDPDLYGVNAACLDDVSPFDFTEIPVADGKNHPRDNDGKRRLAGWLRFTAEAD